MTAVPGLSQFKDLDYAGVFHIDGKSWVRRTAFTILTMKDIARSGRCFGALFGKPFGLPYNQTLVCTSGYSRFVLYSTLSQVGRRNKCGGYTLLGFATTIPN